MLQSLSPRLVFLGIAILAAAAIAIAVGFMSGYLALDAQGAPLSPGILMHGCAGNPGSVSGSNVPDESLIYGDYYFVEALLRHQALATPRIRRVSEPLGQASLRK